MLWTRAHTRTHKQTAHDAVSSCLRAVRSNRGRERERERKREGGRGEREGEEEKRWREERAAASLHLKLHSRTTSVYGSIIGVGFTKVGKKK